MQDARRYHVPNGLLLDIELRQHASLDMHACDPAPCMIIHGIAQIELNELLCRLAAVGLTLDRFRGVANAQRKTCSAFAQEQKYTANASDIISVLPLIRYALDVLADGSAQFKADLAEELASFTALAQCVSLQLEAKRGPAQADDWAAAARDHALLFERAHGDCNLYIPKFHFCRRLPRQVARGGFALDTPVTERRHDESLAVADNIDNARTFETSLLIRRVALQCYNAKEK
eukprot:1719535-Pyramimonas_sp.AAC.1